MVIPAQTEGLSHLWTRFLPTEEQIETFFYLGIAFTAFISSLRDSQKDLRMYIIFNWSMAIEYLRTCTYKLFNATVAQTVRARLTSKILPLI